MTTLKACPFCPPGVEPPVEEMEDCGPGCPNCGVYLDTITEWNTRPEEDRLRALLREALPYLDDNYAASVDKLELIDRIRKEVG